MGFAPTPGPRAGARPRVRPRRARRPRHRRRRRHPARLRLDGRQGHRLRPHPRRGDRAPAPRPARDHRDHRGRHDQPRLPARDPRPPGVQAPARSTSPGWTASACPARWRPTHGADAALLQAAIELADDETATERASFYAYARRGRPEAERAGLARGRGPPPRPGLPDRRLPARPGRYRAEVDGAAVEADGRAPERPRAPDHDRRQHAPHDDLPPGRRPAGRGPRRAAPHHPRRRRLRPQPAARPWSSRSPSARATRWPRATSSRSSSR